VNETPFTIFEHHVTFAAILSMWGGMVGLVVWLLNKHKIWLNIKNRLNDLWWDRCAEKQERYTPLENGTPAVIPPRPRHQHGD
jgi:hypothetical protein